MAASLVTGCSSGSGGSGPASPTAPSAAALPAPGATRVFAVARAGRATVTGVYVEHPDGSVDDPARTTTLAGGVTESVPGFTPPTSATLLSGKVVHTSLQITLSGKGRVLHVPDSISINGGKRETVHVPAGTFSAIPVTIIQDYELDSRGTTVESTTDVASDVGTVRVVTVGRSRSGPPRCW